MPVDRVEAEKWQDGSVAEVRVFVWVTTKSFTGWRCQACRWERPYRRLTDPDRASKVDARIAFDLHKCEESSLVRQKNGCDYP